MKRIKLIILICCITGSNASNAQVEDKRIPDGIYYIVRHAEKDTGKNPVLTADGYLRSGDLYRVLKDRKINRIFVNQYKRIQLTADSLRIYQQIDTVLYVVDESGNGIANKIIELNEPGNILIIAHSNTIPAIIRRLGVTDYTLKELPETVFDNLFIVTVKEGKAGLKQLKYGKASAK